jgi:hypothetical protein
MDLKAVGEDLEARKMELLTGMGAARR